MLAACPCLYVLYIFASGLVAGRLELQQMAADVLLARTGPDCPGKIWQSLQNVPKCSLLYWALAPQVTSATAPADDSVSKAPGITLAHAYAQSK